MSPSAELESLLRDVSKVVTEALIVLLYLGSIFRTPSITVTYLQLLICVK